MTVSRRLADYKVRPYTKDFEYFETYKSNHRQHQTEALTIANSANRGQIVSPCGTGKTRIQVSLHVEEMIRLNKEYEYGVFVIASHRLSLNSQLLDQLVDVAVKCGLPFNVVYVGSYKCDLSKYYTKYHNLGYKPDISKHLISTDSKEIEKFIAESRENFKNVIIASTYDSFACLKNIGDINIITFDEAHNTIQNDFKKNILEVKPNILKEHYFTATRKVVGEDGGMNNEVFYGPILVDVFPKLMLERGEIVEPKLHIIDSEEHQTTNTSNTNMLVKNTIEAYDRHKDMVKRVSFNQEEIGAKLLIGCNSIEEMDRIYNDPLIKECKDKKIQAFAIASEGCYYNWVPCSKDQFFIHLNNLSNSEDAIIFNVDMLTEGMDLPSITGVMPLRNLGQTKLIQLVGRALRLHEKDRNSLYASKLQPNDRQNYIKPYGYLIVPRHLASIDEHKRMIEMAKRFYSEYGTRPEELIIQEKFIDHQPETLDTMIPYPFKDGKDYDLEHSELSLINEVNYSLFEEDMAKLPNDFGKIKYVERMLVE